MTRANHINRKFRRATLVALPLTLAGLFGPTLLPASPPQMLLQYDQAADDRTAAATPATIANNPYARPAAGPQDRYAAPAGATSPYAASPYATGQSAGATAPASYGTPSVSVSNPPLGGATPAPDGNPFLGSGRPRSTLLNTSPASAAAGNTVPGNAAPTTGSRYPSALPSASQPAGMQPTAMQPTAMQPTAMQPTAMQPTAMQPTAMQPGAVQPAGAMVAVPPPASSAARMHYDDQVRPASFDVPPTVPMTSAAPLTPTATVGGPDLATAPNESRYTQPADGRYGDRYAQVPAGTDPYGRPSPLSQQQTQPTQPSYQTASNLPVAQNGGGAAPPQSLSANPQQLSGLAILLQKPLDENAARMQHPLTPFVAWLEDSIRYMDANVRDYACTFKKREFVDGKLQDQQSMFAKMRMQPFSVYFYFLDPAVKGQEALYVAGKNNGNLLAHPIGFKQTLVGTLSLAPNDPQAMDGNRYPITDFGMRRLAERFLERSKYEMQFGECNVRVVEARIDGRACTCVETVHPVKRAEFRYNISRLYIDNELNLPIRCEGYDWPDRQGEQPQLVEEYTFSSLKLNLGFTDLDFDPANPQYTFK